MIYLLYSFNNQKTVCLSPIVCPNQNKNPDSVLCVCPLQCTSSRLCSVLLLLCGWKRIPIVFPFVCSLLFILVVFEFRALLFCLSSNFCLFHFQIVSNKISSGIEGNPTVFYRLIRGSTAQTNKYDTFYLQQRADNGHTWADIKVNHPLDYENIKEYNLTIRVEVK